MKRFNPYLNYSIALIFICMVSFLYFKMKSNDDFIFNIDKTVIPSESIEANISDEPRFPLPIVSVDRIQRPDLMALPALNQSDQYLHLALSETLNDGVAKLLSQTRLIEKIVATIDNLSRNYICMYVYM